MEGFAKKGVCFSSPCLTRIGNESAQHDDGAVCETIMDMDWACLASRDRGERFVYSKDASPSSPTRDDGERPLLWRFQVELCCCVSAVILW